MNILDKVKGLIGSSEEYVIQVNDGIGWDDIGVVEEVLGPEEYDLPEDGRSRLVCRKGDKIKNIVWTNSSRKPAPERKTRSKKQRSAVEEIQLKADRIKRDRDKLIDIKESLGDILGIDDGGAPETHEEWQYPNMMTGLNRGVGHAFLMGMDEKKGDIAEAGLEMVRGFSGVMSAIPVIAVAYAKSKGVNVGLFGMDENMMAGQQQQAPSQYSSPQVDSKAMKEREHGFDVDTIEDEDDYDDDYESDDIVSNVSNKASDIDLSPSGDAAIHEFTIDKRYDKEPDNEPENFDAVEEVGEPEEVANEPGEVINEPEKVAIGNDQLSSDVEHDETPIKIIHNEDELPDNDDDEEVK